MLTKEQMKIALDVARLSAKGQNDFFANLRGTLTDDEIKAFQVVTAYLSILDDPAKLKAVKTATAEILYDEFAKECHK